MPNLLSTLGLLAFLLGPINAAPAAAPAPAPQLSPTCNPSPCASLPQTGWEPYCHQSSLFCTVGPGMITVRVGQCEEWCQPEAPKPKCPPPRPPPAEGCKTDPCAKSGFDGLGLQPYCNEALLYCYAGLISFPIGRCEEWCQPEPKKPAGCP